MVRIIHLTDFHLNPNNLKDWQNHVKDGMIAKLKQIEAEMPISFIAFTGDMIDEGGKAYKTPAIAFKLFSEEIVDPILESLSLPRDKFFFTPGNHDVVRNRDKPRIELGNVEYFKEQRNVSEFVANAIKENDFSGMERMVDYKQFEQEFYSNLKLDFNSNIFGVSFKLKLNNLSVGICCLNSSWRCYGKSDKGRLLIGEEQLSISTHSISDCQVKIALMHHPLDWLSTVEQNIITNHVNKTFDILLVGHVHEHLTAVHTGLNNATLFTNVSPSGLNDIRSDSRSFANGFTVIDFDKRAGQISCQYLRYNHSNERFVLNTDVGNEGVFAIAIPDEISAKDLTLINTVLNNIREDHFQEMDDHLIGQKAEKAATSILEAFIMPPINQGESSISDVEQEANLELNDITKSKFNFMFFGSQETGKTILLYRLIREFMNDYDYLGKIPVYIDFDEIGSKDFETCIKEYLRCSSKNVLNLLNNNLLILLIDNLNYRKNDRIERFKKLDKFLSEYNKIDMPNLRKELRVIATGEIEISGILSPDYISSCKIPFKNYFIKNLKSREIKKLMKLWIPNEGGLESEQRLDKMIVGFNSYSLPSTAMSVSLFLWSMENRERRPINHAVLLEIYIEILLEKLSKNNIYRDRFDFTNKEQLLAKIAEEMLVSNQSNYSILFSEFEKVVEGYLQSVGFDFEAHRIVEYFLERKIFVKHQFNRIKFTYSCYFHFFIAKRMEHNKEFKDYVLQEDNYFKFHREIDYYTALTRSDKEVFEVIFKRFEDRFGETNFILEQIKEEGIDKYFSPTLKGKPTDPIAKNVEINRIKENRPSEEMMEDFQNKKLEAIPDPSMIIKKDGDISLDVLITLMANVLRNSEGVEDRELKKRAYNSLIKYNLVYMILYKQYLIDYVLKNKKLPPSILFEITLEQLLVDIPYHVQLALYQHAGSAKLAPIVLDKIKQDNEGLSVTDSDIESFLSVALYGDIQGKDYPKHFKSLIKRIKSNVGRDYTFYKLIQYYYLRTKRGSPKEEIYLDLLSELRIRSQNLPRRLKERVIKSLQEGKKTFVRTFEN